MQYVDTAVSIAKFEQQMEEYQELAREYQQRGWLLIEACFPEVFVAFAAAAIRPAPLVVGALFDYTNYDAEPPSVRLVDPLTREPYLQKDLPTPLNRAQPTQIVPMPGVPGGVQMQAVQPLMQAHAPDEVPFLCLAGVREYHDHPGHSGDVWDLHRAGGSGRLVRLLELIYRYGVEPVRAYSVNMVVGLQTGPPPQ